VSATLQEIKRDEEIKRDRHIYADVESRELTGFASRSGELGNVPVCPSRFPSLISLDFFRPV
jgi:hypothetical protein